MSMEHDEGAEPAPLTDEQINAVVDRDAPPEINHAAVAELDRIHHAQAYQTTPEPDYDPAYGIGPGGGSVNYEPSVGQATASPSSKQPHTLEDLYSVYPLIGNGSFYLRVTRKHPTTFGGLRCAGWIEDVHEQITLSQFAERFGGHVYEVAVRGPGQRTSIVDASGQVQSNTLNKIKIEVSGPPIMQPSSETTMPNQPPFATFGEDPRVQIKKLDLEADAMRRRELRDERNRQELLTRGSVSADVLEAVQRAAEKGGDDARRASAEVIASLKEQNHRLLEQAQVKDDAIQKLRQEMLQIQQQASLQLREEETRAVRDLRERFNDEVRRVKEDHATAIQAMQTEHQRVVNDLTERAQRERDHITKMEQMERDRIRDDASRREKDLRDEYARREREMRETQQQRLTDIERSFERELRGIKDMRDREIESIRSSETGKSALTKQTAEIQQSMLMNESNRMQSEVDALRRENEDLRSQILAHASKDPLTAVREAHELAAQTGYKGDAPAEEEFDWKRGMVSAVKGLIEKGPEIAKGFGDAREQNRVAVARAQQQAQMARMRAAHAARQHRPPPQVGPAPPMAQPAPHPAPPPEHRPAPPPGVVPPPAPSPRTWDDANGPPEPGSPVNLPDNTHFRPVIEPKAPPPMEGGKAPEPTPVPIGGESEAQQVVAPELTQQPAEPEPDSDDQQAAPDAVDFEVQEPSAVAISEEQVARFSSQLEAAIGTGLVSPAEFAKGFIDEAGVETTAAIILQIGPDDLVDAVEAQPGSEQTAIVTRAGRKFVRELWEEARKIIEATAAQ